MNSNDGQGAEEVETGTGPALTATEQERVDAGQPDSRQPAQNVSIVGWRNWGDHPLVVLFTALMSVVGLGLGFLSLQQSETNDSVRSINPCIDVVGRWDWLTTGGTVTIAEGGGLSWFPVAVNPVPAVVGIWSCSQETGELELRWSTGLSDLMHLSVDGMRLSGTNQQNQSVISAARIN
ncbi:MAG: hypothetical protein R3F41_12855 [Gammaproteobacteria bacterium]|nr:hypothetical protein [Pseudomonadales bacterium]MCP5348987.1 hypothetical protein [Pseudomonadales bacterium]